MKGVEFRRMKLRWADGKVYLDRWGVQLDWLGAIYLHRMEAEDPGLDLHDHPWTFWSLILKGGYAERRAPIRDPKDETSIYRASWSIRRLGLDECHRITALLGNRPCWTLVLRGPRRRLWGFYTDDGWIDERTHDETVRVDRRDMWNEVGS